MPFCYTGFMINEPQHTANPFADVFRRAFVDDVLNGALQIPHGMNVHTPRTTAFMQSLNRFLQNNNLAPLEYRHYAFDERKLLDYALFLRGYMRDAQKVLANLKQEHATSPDLIELFHAASEYAVACNHQLKDKRVFDNNVGYHTWRIDLHNGLKNALYQPVNSSISANRHALFLFMPFRIEPQQQQLSKWVYNNMRHTLDNRQIFGAKTDVYVVHYPIQKSRCSNIASLLQTIHNTQYIEKQDIDFVKQNWLSYIAQEIKLDDQGKVLTAQPYTPEQLEQNFSNITVFSYCAGTANAHRCLTALQHITAQIYGAAQAQKAMQNVLLCSYGYLPMQHHNAYAGVHFYSNAVDDENRREPFVNLNNHALYEQSKCRQTDASARFSVMPDGRNFVVAIQLSDKLCYFDDGRPKTYYDGEFGHSMLNVNTPNICDTQNFAHKLFCSVIEKGSIGVRGTELLRLNQTAHSDNQIQSAVLLSRLQKIR